MISYEIPLTLGWDISNVVVAIGADVTRFRLGDAVYSRPDITLNGTYAEFAAIRESEIPHKPQTISHNETASLPLAGITDREALITSARLTSGQQVLIHAGSGSVGSLTGQLAKSGGAYVITTKSGKNKTFVESLGADEVIDYQADQLTEILQDLDVVFDTLGGGIQNSTWSVLEQGGILVSIVSPPSEQKTRKLGIRGALVFIKPNAYVLEQLVKLVDHGQMRPIGGAEFKLHDIAKAHVLSETDVAISKVILYVGQP